MALANNGTYTYIGNTANAFYRGVYTRAASYEMAVKFERVKHSTILPSFDTRNPFNDPSCTFDDSNADVDYNPVQLTVSGMSIQKEICYDDLQGLDLSQFLPAGANNDGIDGTVIEEQLQEIVAAAAAEQLERLLWQGNTTAGPTSPLRFFNGWIAQMLANATPTVPGAVTINAGNIVAQMNAMHLAILTKFPDTWMDSDFYWCIPMNVYGLVIAQNAAQNTAAGHLTDYTTMPLMWNGVKLRACVGLTANNMVATHQRNFAVGTDLTDDLATMTIVNMLATTGDAKVRMVGRSKMGTALRRYFDALLYNV